MAIEATKANGTAPLQEPTLAQLLSLSFITSISIDPHWKRSCASLGDS